MLSDYYRPTAHQSPQDRFRLRIAGSGEEVEKLSSLTWGIIRAEQIRANNLCPSNVELEIVDSWSDAVNGSVVWRENGNEPTDS